MDVDTYLDFSFLLFMGPQWLTSLFVFRSYPISLRLKYFFVCECSFLLLDFIGELNFGVEPFCSKVVPQK